MRSGEIVVVGSDSVSIILVHGKPARVRVWFKESLVEVPCNVSALDELDFGVEETNKHIVLNIAWTVSSVKTIKWEVDY